MRVTRFCVHLSLSVSCFFFGANALPDPKTAESGTFGSFSGDIVAGRQLRAARKSSHIRARDITAMLSYDHELHYLDADTYDTPSHFAAQVSMSMRSPAVLLEDIEILTEDIKCRGSNVVLYFTTVETTTLVHTELNSVENLLLVTSHKDCNHDGERAVHRVSAIEMDTAERVIRFTVSQVQWKDTFHTVTVDFGETMADYELRDHRPLQPRGSTGTSTASTASVSASTSVKFPTPTLSASPSLQKNVTENINRQWIDTAILPPDNALGTLIAMGPPIPAGFTIACKNCSIQGSIDISSGSFSMTSVNGSSNQTENLANFFFNDGYVELLANDFAAHIQLESSLEPTQSPFTYTAPLPPISFIPFQIPGIAAVGPQMKPVLSIGFEVSTKLDFVYGFDVAVPNKSNIIIDVANLTNSSMHGFGDTKVTALPFQAGIENAALTVTAGFKPELLLGISIIGSAATAGFGVFFDLPSVSATVAEVAHVDSKCESASATTTTKGALPDLFDSLTHITGSVDVGFGILAQADLVIGFHENVTFPLLSTSFPLPTACIRFDKKASTFGPASATSTSGIGPNGNGHGNGNGKTSDASHIAVPSSTVFGGLKRLGAAAGLLLLVSACFVTL